LSEFGHIAQRGFWQSGHLYVNAIFCCGIGREAALLAMSGRHPALRLFRAAICITMRYRGFRSKRARRGRHKCRGWAGYFKWMACRALFGVQFTGLPLENHGHLIVYHACCLLHAIYQFDDILKRSLSSWTGFQAPWEHASKHSHVRTAHMLAILLHSRLYQFCVGKVLAGTVDA
jgi:hypothetical protein